MEGGFREAADIPLPKNHLSKDRFFDDELYLETIPEMFANLRDRLGFSLKTNARRSRAPSPT